MSGIRRKMGNASALLHNDCQVSHCRKLRWTDRKLPGSETWAKFDMTS